MLAIVGLGGGAAGVHTATVSSLCQCLSTQAGRFAACSQNRYSTPFTRPLQVSFQTLSETVGEAEGEGVDEEFWTQKSKPRH